MCVFLFIIVKILFLLSLDKIYIFIKQGKLIMMYVRVYT